MSMGVQGKVPNGLETLPKISIALVGCTNVPDEKRQTDGRAMTYSEREPEFTFSKNLKKSASAETRSVIFMFILKFTQHKRTKNIQSDCKTKYMRRYRQVGLHAHLVYQTKLYTI